MDEQQQTADERAQDGVRLPVVATTFQEATSRSVQTLCVQSSQERDLGVYMTMTTHINHVLSSCLISVHCDRYDSSSGLCHRMHMHTLVTSLVHSRLDYCNAVFAVLPARDLQRLHPALNAAVRLVSNSSSHCHVTPLLKIVTGCPSDSMCSTVQAVRASPPLFVRRGILSSRARRPDRHSKQQSWSEVGTVAVHHCATYTHSTLGDRAFSVATPRACTCNNLPQHVRHISSMDVLSKNLKSLLWSPYVIGQTIIHSEP